MLLQADKKACLLHKCKSKKKARKITPSQYKAKQIHSIHAEPNGVCATTSRRGTSDNHNAVKKVGNLRAITHESG
jgi:hypothetical protein